MVTDTENCKFVSVWMRVQGNKLLAHYQLCTSLCKYNCEQSLVDRKLLIYCFATYAPIKRIVKSVLLYVTPQEVIAHMFCFQQETSSLLPLNIAHDHPFFTKCEKGWDMNFWMLYMSYKMSCKTDNT